MSEENPETKHLFFNLEPQLIKAMDCLFLAACAQVPYLKIRPEVTPDYFNYLISKGDLTGEFGAAKMAFTMRTMLSSIFIDIMKTPKDRASIMVEMILSMAATGQDAYANMDEMKEGPSRAADAVPK